MMPSQCPLEREKCVDQDNETNWSAEHQQYEQQAMAEYIRAGDVVWNLGVDIGTSFTTAEKLLLFLLGGAKFHTISLEPNNLRAPLLATNFKNNHVEKIVLLCGLISHAVHCPQDAPVFCTGQNTFIRGPEYRLPKVMSYGEFFAHCEGCLPIIFRRFWANFARPELRVGIYELEGKDGSLQKGLGGDGRRLYADGARSR